MTRSLLALLAVIAAMLVVAAPAAAQGKDFYGVIPQGGPFNTQPRDFELMKNNRVGSIRFLVNWEQYRNNLAPLDPIVGRAAAQGIRSMPFIFQRPAPRTRAQRRAMAQFANEMASRYGRGGTFWKGPYQQRFAGGAPPRPIVSWQILNEQNGRAYWGGRPSPRSYARTLKMTTRAIRRANKRAEIVLGGMFFNPRGKGSRTSTNYLKRLYGLKGINVKRFFNTVAIHPYAANLKGMRRHIVRTRRVMRRHGHRKGRLRVTEFGWGSARGGHHLNKGPRGQRNMLRKSFRMLKKNRKRWRLRGAHWFSWQDGNVKCPYCESSGLVERNRSPKPALRAFRRVAR